MVPRLADALRDRALLLVLDNFEQVMETRVTKPGRRGYPLGPDGPSPADPSSVPCHPPPPFVLDGVAALDKESLLPMDRPGPWPR